VNIWTPLGGQIKLNKVAVASLVGIHTDLIFRITTGQRRRWRCACAVEVCGVTTVAEPVLSPHGEEAAIAFGDVGAVGETDVAFAENLKFVVSVPDPYLEGIGFAVSKVGDRLPLHHKPTVASATTEGVNQHPSAGGWVQVRPEGGDDIVGRLRVRQIRVDRGDIGLGAAANEYITVRDDADPVVGLARIPEGWHGEVVDALISSADIYVTTELR